MQLHALLRHFDPQLSLSGISNVEISGVCEDSRRAAKGSLFIARTGTKANGLEFIADAKSHGAVAVAMQSKVSRSPLPQIVVKDAARAASVLANLYHGSPSLKMRCFAVTGTNGKTTTTYVIRHLLGKVNQRCGLIGTVEIDEGRLRRPADMTTPSGCEGAQLMANMPDRGCRP